MPDPAVEAAVVEGLNAIIEKGDVRVRLELTAAQDGGAGEPDVLGYSYRTVMVSLYLFPDQDAKALVELLRSTIDQNPGLADDQGPKRVFWTTWRDSEEPEKDALGSRITVWLNVAPLIS